MLSQIEVSKLVTENNKTYVSVDGKPFPFLGAQIRLDALLNCDKMTINEVENYFKKAQELGLNCVQIPISWNMVEPKENKYDYSILNSILQFVNKYNLKMELLLVQYEYGRRFILLPDTSICTSRI
ncbi:beta-galactosidase [Bacteroides faecis]|nr:beta-galactosidase [Bacteroides faecis]